MVKKSAKVLCKIVSKNSPVKQIVMTMEAEFNKNATEKEIAWTMEQMPSGLAAMNSVAYGYKMVLLEQDGVKVKKKATKPKIKEKFITYDEVIEKWNLKPAKKSGTRKKKK